MKFLCTQFLDIFPKYANFVLHSLTYTFLLRACENWKFWELFKVSPKITIFFPTFFSQELIAIFPAKYLQYIVPYVFDLCFQKSSHLFFIGAGTNCGWTTLQMALVDAATCSIISFSFHSINLPSITVLILKLFWIKLLITTMPPSTISAEKGKGRKHR